MTPGSAITPQMRDAIGVESEPATHEVEKGAIRRFAEAIGDSNPLFHDEEAARRSPFGRLVAPPTFLRSLAPGPPRAPFAIPYDGLLDGGSEWEYFGPVRAGDRITVTTTVSDIFERRGRLGNMLFITRQTRYVDQSGKTAAVQRNTLIHYPTGVQRGASAGSTSGSGPAPGRSGGRSAP